MSSSSQVCFLNCSDIFYSVDRRCYRCFKNFLTINEDSINYTIHLNPFSRMIFDADGQIIVQTPDLSNGKEYLADYVFNKGLHDLRFLKDIIERKCPHKFTFDQLFGLIFENGREHISIPGYLNGIVKYTEQLSEIIIIALQHSEEWYIFEESECVEEYSFSKYATYIPKLAEYMWVFEKLKKNYKELICKLIDCGEKLYEKDKSDIEESLMETYDYISSKVKRRKQVKHIVNELYTIYEDYTLLLIKEPIE